MSYRTKLLPISMAAGLAAIFTPVTSVSAQDGESSRMLEEIVVTARRREESLQDVPVSVTAFTPELMEAKGISQPYDLIGNVPGLTAQGGSANRNDVNFFIRGQGITFGSSPSVVQYFAETPVEPNSASGGQNITYYDLESIEVLKGPQGTLFGRPTTGGAVLINPKRPTYEFDGFVEAKLGNYASRDITAAINVPLIEDKLAVRIAANMSYHDGYSKSRVTGQELDDRNRDSYRIGVLFEPTSWFSNYFLFEDNRIDENGTAIINAFLDEDHPLLTTDTNFAPAVGFVEAGAMEITSGGIIRFAICPNAPFFGQTVAQCVSDRIARVDSVRNGLIAERQRLGDNDGDEVRTAAHSNFNFLDSHVQKIINITRIDLGKWGFLGDTSLKNIYQTNRNEKSSVVREIGGSPIEHAVVYNNLDIVNGDPVQSSRFGKSDWDDRFSEEIQLSGMALDRHAWVLGYFYEKSDKTIYQNGPAIFSTLDGAFTVPAGLPAISSGFTDEFEQENTGIYAQTTLDLADIGLDDFKLTLGYRWSKFEQQQTNVDTVITLDGVARAQTLNPLSADLEQKEDSYTVALDWQATENLMLYATHRRGFKQGGINAQSIPFVGIAPLANATFEPETVKDYEVGAKWDWNFGGVIGRTNVAIFKAEYTDLHRNETFFNGTGVSAQIGNIAEATTQGLELENSMQLTDNVRVDLTYSYLDAEYDKYPGAVYNSAQQVVQLVDQDFSGAPEHIFGALFQYWLPMVPAGYGEVKASLNYTYQGEMILGDGQQYNAVDETQESYDLLNLRLDWNNVMGNSVDMALFVKNATDEVYGIANSALMDAFGHVGRAYGNPRTYGFEIKARFGASAN
jgi:iron complex outermembrane receptor protein